MKFPLLIVDDDRRLLAALRNGLKYDYDIDTAQSLKRARLQVSKRDYACLILDLTLPDGNGMDLCTELRAAGNNMPVLVLSGVDYEPHKVRLLEAGADSYLTKPCGLATIAAQLRALHRRHRMSSAQGSELRVGDVVMNVATRSVMREGREIILRPMEFTLLECLLRHAGSTVLRKRLVASGWGKGDEPGGTSLAAHISNLRQSFDEPFEHKLIETVTGSGYRIMPPKPVRPSGTAEA